MSPNTAEQWFGTPVALGLGVLVLLAGLLGLAAWTDIRQRRVPNVLVVSGVLIAIGFHSVLPAGNGFISPLPGGLGGMAALTGLACGLCAMWPLHRWFGMGAGDVKLTAMLGAFLGPQAIWPAILASLVAGGVLAIALLSRQRGHRATAREMSSVAVGRLPYAPAIAVGSLAYLTFQAMQLGYFR